MLSTKMVRVRHARNRIIPQYIDVADPQWRSAAERLLDLYRSAQGSTRGELEEEIAEAIGSSPTQIVHQGLAKLLEDRCEFDVDSSHPPDELREILFKEAAERRAAGAFDRQAIIEKTAAQLALTCEQVDQGFFADLKREQRCLSFLDCTVDQLLQRYNVALAQAILLRSTKVKVRIIGETAVRYRQLFRAIKFHRLICTFQKDGADAYTLTIDGPLSLFSSTQKYGLQLAVFLPTVLQCKEFDLTAVVRWGVQRKEKEFCLDSRQGLRSHTVDHGDYIPAELLMFVEMFRKNGEGWEIALEPTVLSIGTSFWAPDVVIVDKKSGKKVYIEILGFWRRIDVDKHIARLKNELREPFILCVSEQFNIDEALSDEGNASIYQFKRTPLPEEVIARAQALIDRIG